MQFVNTDNTGINGAFQNLIGFPGEHDGPSPTHLTVAWRAASANKLGQVME